MLEIKPRALKKYRYLNLNVFYIIKVLTFANGDLNQYKIILPLFGSA